MDSFDYQPTLTDGTVTLRPLCADDWPMLYAVARDPEIWAVHPAPDRWQEAPFRAYFDSCLASGGALVIEDPATHEVLGLSRYDRDRADLGEIEIGWTFLARSCWGGATNLAVKRLMIAHALASFDQVIFLIGEDNARSRRALDKIGGRLMSRQYDALIEGRTVRHVMVAIDRDAFANGPLMSLNMPDTRS